MNLSFLFVNISANMSGENMDTDDIENEEIDDAELDISEGSGEAAE